MFTTLALSFDLVVVSFVVLFFGSLGWTLAAWLLGKVLK